MRRSLPGDPYRREFFVPDVLEISLERFEKAYPVWVVYRAFDRMIPPTEIRKQPDSLLEDILYIDSVFDPMVSQRLEAYRKRQEEQNG